MLPPESCLPRPTGRSGPACSCIQKPLPCLVTDPWVNGPAIPFEQPLSIQTDMEYTLDNRMFPGWDPVTGKTEPALVIDTAALALTGATAVGAAAPVLPSPVSSPAAVVTSIHSTPPRSHTTRGMCGVSNPSTTTPSHHHHHHFSSRSNSICRTRLQNQQAAAAAARISGLASSTWGTPATAGQVLPATPAPLPAHAASYHPAFRPSDPARMYSARQHALLQQRAAATNSVTHLPCDAIPPDHDILSLIASFDAEPSGYSLDVDWLIGQQPSPPLPHHHPTTGATTTTTLPFTDPSKRPNDLLINAAAAATTSNHRLQQQEQQHQYHTRQTRLQAYLRGRSNNPAAAASNNGRDLNLSQQQAVTTRNNNLATSSCANIVSSCAGGAINSNSRVNGQMVIASSNNGRCLTSSNGHPDHITRSIAYGVYHAGGLTSTTPTVAHNDLLTYQSQFYPGAVLRQQQQEQLQRRNMAAVASSGVVVSSPYAPLQQQQQQQQRSRPVKRKLSMIVDSPCEGALATHLPPQLYCHTAVNPQLTAAALDVTLANKRPRWSLSVNPQDLGLHAHVPSPFQARAY